MRTDADPAAAGGYFANVIIHHSENTTMKLLTASLIAIAVLSLNATADETTAQPVRSIIERHDQSGVPGKEIVIGTATLPPGSVIGYHTHPGDEAGYVLKGNLILKTQGQPDRVLKAGDSFFNPRGAVHSLGAAPGPDGGMAVSAWIVDKGEPLATPVPAAK
jgi:quercetin dioxygenase-like cupin family protein